MRACRQLLVVIAALAVFLSSATTVLAGDEEPPWFQWHEWAIQGEVLGAGSRFLLITTPRGEAPVLTGEMTVFRIPGLENGSIEDIDTGARIIVVGRRAGPIVAARLVAVLEPGAELAGVGGQVGDVSDGRIAVNSLSGGVVVLSIDDDALVLKPGAGEVTPDDVQVGHVIAAAGVWSEDGSLQTLVIILPGQLERVVRITGDIEAVEDSALTISTGDGREVLVQTDDGTTLHSLDEGNTLQDLEVGQRVTATAQVRESSLYATRVLLWPENTIRLLGKVTGVDATTLWLDTRRGELEVLAGSSTIVHIPGVEEPSLQDVGVGDSVTCVGALGDDSSLYALVIAVHRQP